MSYGYTLEADYDSNIVIIDFNSGSTRSVTDKGIVKKWKDEGTVLYETLTDTYSEGSLYPDKIIKEIAI